MTKAKIDKKLANLIKIKEIIRVSKFDTLQKLEKAMKISDTFIQMGLMAKNLIKFAEEHYKIKAHQIKDNHKTVWVLITSESEMLSTSTAKFQNMVEEGFDPNLDMLIALGDEAQGFAERTNFRTIFKSPEVNPVIENKVSSLISSLISAKRATHVKFVLNSPKVGNHPISVFPIEDLNIDTKFEDIAIDKKYKFFPSITVALNSLTSIYISRITQGLIEEAKTFHLKEKLIKHEGALTNVDERIKKVRMQRQKLVRKHETEELILVTQVAKRGGDNE